MWHIPCGDRQNHVYGVAHSRGNTTSEWSTVWHFLGSFDDVGLREAAFLSATWRCWSFTFHEPSFPDPDFARQCFGLSQPRFSPTPQALDSTGVVQWPCRADTDCSLNGQ